MILLAAILVFLLCILNLVLEHRELGYIRMESVIILIVAGFMDAVAIALTYLQ